MTAQRVVRGNCVLWAVWRYAALTAAWWRSGKPEGVEPALRVRASRLEPRKAPHVEVEHWDGTHWVREGWVPLDKRPLPWWRLWRALWGNGEIVSEVLHGYTAA